MPGSIRAIALIAALCALVAAPVASGAQDPVLVYAGQPAAGIVHDGVGASFRQQPAVPDARWRGSRLLAKVRGRELSTVSSASAMAARLRTAWHVEGTGYVGIDEILPGHWTVEGAQRLANAMALLGPEASRVIFYAGPSMVEQVGRADPRRALPTKLQLLVNAMAQGRATYLMTYRGDLQPFPEREMAAHPTRWVQRWPAAIDRLRIMIGPDGGLGQRELWNRVRSTPAGRRLLANGPAAYGLRTREAAQRWLDQYRAFLNSPDTSPTGADARVPRPGGLSLGRMNKRIVTITIARPGRAVVRLVQPGNERGRVIKSLWGPTLGKRGILLPRDSRPGRYTLVAVLQGDGLRDEARMPLQIRS